MVHTVVHAIILHRKIKHGIHHNPTKGRARGRSLQPTGDGGGEGQHMMEGVGANDHGIGDMERSTLTDDSSQQHRDLSPGQHGKPPENGYLQ